MDCKYIDIEISRIKRIECNDNLNHQRYVGVIQYHCEIVKSLEPKRKRINVDAKT